MAKNVLAFDFGGSSGRAVLASFDGAKITLNEVYRFDNEPVTVNGSFYWDTLRLWNELKNGIRAANQVGDYDSIGIDTWGVDYGVLSAGGRLIENAYHYRDKRTEGMVELAAQMMPKAELYRRTGNQIIGINTLFQLMAMKQDTPDVVSITDKFLMTPDLFNYFLTGKQFCERTMASTTQMMNPFTKEWDIELVEQFGIPAHILPTIIPAGTVIGQMTDVLCEELAMQPKKVIAVASHDTASAVVAVPTAETEFAFLSCGTWSLFGTELCAPLVNETSAACNLTNETGYGDTTHFLNNIIGLWLIQETRRQYKREGKNYSYAEMEKMAKECTPFHCFIDPDEPEFVPQGDIPTRIKEFCKKTGQPVPSTDGAVVRCIYESLALKYKHTLIQMEACTQKSFDTLHIVGGGTKDGFLCQLTADAIGCVVIAGPAEATALGNVAVQLIAQGEIATVTQARAIVAASSDVFTYQPQDCEPWQAAYAVFCEEVI